MALSDKEVEAIERECLEVEATRPEVQLRKLARIEQLMRDMEMRTEEAMVSVLKANAAMQKEWQEESAYHRTVQNGLLTKIGKLKQRIVALEEQQQRKPWWRLW
jgi:hypothetical protein